VLQSLVFLIHSTLAVNLHEIKIGCASRFLTAQIVIAADVCHNFNYAHAHEGRPFSHCVRRVDVRRADERYGSSHFGRACVSGELDAVNLLFCRNNNGI
jgi:hypothetical protein